MFEINPFCHASNGSMYTCTHQFLVSVDLLKLAPRTPANPHLRARYSRLDSRPVYSKVGWLEI